AGGRVPAGGPLPVVLHLMRRLGGELFGGRFPAPGRPRGGPRRRRAGVSQGRVALGAGAVWPGRGHGVRRAAWSMRPVRVAYTCLCRSGGGGARSTRRASHQPSTASRTAVATAGSM